jgi:hypothetical protein
MHGIFPLILSCISPLASISAEDIGAIQAVTKYKTAIASIHNFNVKYTVETRYLVKEVFVLGKDGYPQIVERRLLSAGESGKTQRHFTHHQYDYPKERMEQWQSSDGELLSLLVFDGEKQKCYFPTNKHGQIDKLNFSRGAAGTQYPDGYLTLDGRLLLSTFLGQRNNLIARILPDRSIELSSSPQPELVNRINYASSGFKIILDPAHGMMPSTIVQLEIWNDGNVRNARETTVEEWKKLSNNSWVPTKLRTKWFDMNHKMSTYGKVYRETVLAVDCITSTWNEGVNKGAFLLVFPNGTQVTDRINNIDYTAGTRRPRNND